MLTTIATAVGTFVMNYLWQHVVVALGAIVLGWIHFGQIKKEITQQADDSVKPLEQAKTAEEIDNAADDALNHL